VPALQRGADRMKVLRNIHQDSHGTYLSLQGGGLGISGGCGCGQEGIGGRECLCKCIRRLNGWRIQQGRRDSGRCGQGWGGGRGVLDGLHEKS
jgi:hypothetical protein